MQTKKPTVLFHTGNYSGSLQITIQHSVGNWELVWPALIRENRVLVEHVDRPAKVESEVAIVLEMLAPFPHACLLARSFVSLLRFAGRSAALRFFPHQHSQSSSERSFTKQSTLEGQGFGAMGGLTLDLRPGAGLGAFIIGDSHNSLHPNSRQFLQETERLQSEIRIFSCLSSEKMASITIFRVYG
jgi:hypothetical protein